MPLIEDSEQEVSSSSGDEGLDVIREQQSEVNGLGSLDLSNAPDYMYSSNRLMEEVDENLGIQSIEFARIGQTMSREVCPEKEVAIIAYWKQTPSHVFKCYHYFYVPNPMKRVIKDVADATLHQMLYTGQKGEIFFFYKQINQLGFKFVKLGIVDVNSSILKTNDMKQETYLQQATGNIRSVDENCTKIISLDSSSVLTKFIHDLN